MPKPQLKNIEEHLQFLVGERNPFTEPDHLEKIRLYITKQFESFNLSVNQEAVDFENSRSFNIIGKPTGTQSTPFVLAAHYNTKPGTSGADDNASAVAALLEIARCLTDHTFHTPIIFFAFTLEEYGFIGSRHFIEKAVTRNETDSGDFIALVGNQPSAHLTQSLAEGMKQHVPSLKVETLVIPGTGENFSGVGLSDHAPFWDAGIPAVMVTDTAFFRNPNYHQPSDTLETLDIEFIRENPEAVAETLKTLLGKK
jgi:aminopeptidase YwaD